MFSSKLDFTRSVYFDSNEYLVNKTAALNASKEGGHSNWTTASTLKAIQDAGMSVWEHFTSYGAYERAADGGYGINPSAYFDMDRYYAEKVAQCKDVGLTYTKQSLVNVFKDAGLDPITHYALYGYAESLSPRLEDMSATSYNYSSSRPLSGDYKIDSLLFSSADRNPLYAAQGNVLYYSFAESLPNSFMQTNNISRYYNMNDNQKTGVHTAAEYIQAVTGIEMVYTANFANADISFFWGYDGNPQYGGATYYRGNGPDYVRLSSNLDSSNRTMYQDWQKGTDAYATLIHELGHALGLKHPFESSGSGKTLPAGEDNDIYTAMSYTSAQSTGDTWYYATGSGDYFSPYDLMALNYLYGSDGLNGREGLVYRPGSYSSNSVTGRGDTLLAAALNDLETLFSLTAPEADISGLSAEPRTAPQFEENVTIPEMMISPEIFPWA